MELVGHALTFLMLASPFIALCCAALVYSAYSERSDARNRRLLPFMVGIALFGIGFLVLGTIVGTGSVCMLTQSAQCGLTAAFIAPVSFALGVVLYLLSWVRNARNTP